MAQLKLCLLNDGFFGLDGGAMFGVVPRVLWQKTNPPDERSRIRLALRLLLITTPEERILVDTGIGTKHGPEFDAMFNVDRSDNLDAALSRLNLNPEEITTVILTHLHFDHAGGATKLDDSGKPVPRFPNARYVVQEMEWHDATHPNRRTRGSYRADDFLPLEAAGKLELVDGDTELMPGVKLLRTGGHTRGHQIVLVESEARTCVYWADLVPTCSHVNIPYIMGYDLFPLDTMKQKEELIARAAAGKWACVFEHDPETELGLITSTDGRYRVRSISPTPTKGAENEQ